MRASSLAGLLATLAWTSSSLAQDPARPRPDHERVEADLAAIVSMIEVDRGGAVAYTGSLTAVNFIRGHALIYTVACEELPTYRAKYFIYTELEGKPAVGELLEGAGEENVRRLEGKALEDYLRRVRLDPAPLRAVFRRHYAPPTRR